MIRPSLVSRLGDKSREEQSMAYEDKMHDRDVIDLGQVDAETKGPSGILGDVNGQQPSLGLSND